MVMWYLKYLITFGLINGGIFLLGVTAFTFDDDIMGSFFTKILLASNIITSIWLAITLKRGNKLQSKQEQRKEAI